MTKKVTFFQLRKRYKKLFKQKKKYFKHSFLTHLSDMNEKDPKAFWKTLDKVENSDVKENNPINLHAWQEYFKSLLNSDEEITDMTVNQTRTETLPLIHTMTKILTSFSPAKN